ncbi:uncharacterized protein LOC107640924 [Arachis ipaensis]|uniref:uncharacterized protein LOC107640924 n=1 Tax=Arachis ipaensis TaxID=130454 RepID=UPI0007AFCCE4|nr:uncharacterized protein LOC107640924 [Arachis ipaensis]
MEVDTLDAILAQNKIMSQQISMVSQHLTGMQVSAVNTQEASYDMTGSYNQGDAYGYAQPTTEQLSKRITERPPNTFSSNTEVNPREECKALAMAKEAEPKEVHAAKKLKEEKAQEEAGSTMLHAPLVAQEPEVQPPQKPQEETKDEQLTQFLEIFKKLYINIPLAEVLEKMPLYMAFMKGILSKKKALKGDETLVLTKVCSALIQRKLPKKMPNPESFLISCTIGNITLEKALCDLGSSINLMPLSVMKKLGIQEA